MNHVWYNWHIKDVYHVISIIFYQSTSTGFNSDIDSYKPQARDKKWMKKNKTHVFGLGRAPLPRHTKERHAAFPLPLQYSGFRFPFGAHQTLISADPRDPPPPLLSLLSQITNKKPAPTITIDAINHFPESTLVSVDPTHDIPSRLFRFTR